MAKYWGKEQNEAERKYQEAINMNVAKREKLDRKR
jgi:hypothetical protein